MWDGELVVGGVDQRIRVGEGKSEEGEDPSHPGEMEGHRNETGKREQLYRLATSVPLPSARRCQTGAVC